MSDDPMLDKLIRFTPAAGGLDRDELLFRAGRASAPSPRWWKRATAALLVAQAVTLGLWLGVSDRPQTAVPPTVGPAPAVAPGLPEPAAPSSYLVLSRDWDGDRRPSVPDGGVEPRRSPDDPLTAGDRRLSFD